MSQLVAIADPLLTDASSMYKPEGCISEVLFPFIGAMTSTGKLAKYGTNHLRIEITSKAGRGKYRRVESITRSTTDYSIEGHGLEGMVTKEDYKNVQNPYDAEQDETIGVTSILQIEKEYGIATSLSDTAVLTQNVTLSGDSQFSDYDNSDPVTRMKTARQAVKTGCGKAPNVVFMDWKVADTLRFHPQILDFLGFKFARPSGLTDDELAKAAGVQKCIVADVDYESAKEGQTSSMTAVWGKHMWFAVLPERAEKYQVSAGYRIGYAGESARKVYKEAQFNPPGSTKILVEDNYDYVLSNVGGLYLIKAAIA